MITRAIAVAESCMTNLGAAASERPSVFIGSSREGLHIAAAIKRRLSQACDVDLWNEGLFRIGALIIEVLEAAAQSYEFGIFVLTPDDEVHRRGQRQPTFRDNVIFECGLFIGAMSRGRTFIVAPVDAVGLLPTDLGGVVVAAYEAQIASLDEGMSGPCAQVLQAIHEAFR
jgi:predicted nucleotide-binding protein